MPARYKITPRRQWQWKHRSLQGSIALIENAVRELLSPNEFKLLKAILAQALANSLESRP